MFRHWILAAVTAWSAVAWAADRPNFVIFMTDDQRFDAMSCAGNKVLRTPNLDRLAGEGVRFRNAFVTNSLCAPSRATILTGKYSHATGVMDNKARTIKPDQVLFTQLLQKAGYEVAFCGKSHVTGSLRDYKWDYYFGYKDQGKYINPRIAEGTDGKDEVRQGYMDDIVTGKAADWLTSRKSDKPFCLLLWFKASHRSWNRAPRHADLFKDTAIPKPATFDADFKGKPKAFIEADNRIGKFKDVLTLDSFLKDYYSTLTAMDENVGRVLEVLTKKGQLDETFIMHTSDNGFFAGEWQMFDKRFMHEPSIRVPMLVRYPKLIKAGSLNDKMVLNIDIAPTVLDLAGVKVPTDLHGRSMVALLKNQPAPWRKDWLYEYFEFPGAHSVRKNRGVRTERYKYIHYFEAPEEFELYDLQKDPDERDNLYGRPEYAELTKQLRERMTELRKETGDTTK